MSAKRAIIKHFHCSEELFNRARKIWLVENALDGMLLGMRFETMTWESIGKYIQKAADELKQKEATALRKSAQ